MKEAETIDFLEEIYSNIVCIERLIGLLDDGSRIRNISNKELRILRIADCSTEYARDLVIDLMKMHPRK